MSVEIHLASRYLFARQRGAWGWLISWMATGSVALGVAALIVTLAVMTGFREDIREKILGVQPHLLITEFDGRMNAADPKLVQILNQHKNVKAWSPYVMGQVLIGYGSQSSGALLKGIRFETEDDVTGLHHRLIKGNGRDIDSRLKSKKPGILLGQELARNLGARLTDTVWIVTPGSIQITDMALPKAHLFEVVGLVQTGLYDYDSTLAYVEMGSAQTLFGLGQDVSGVGLRANDPDLSETLASELQRLFEGRYWVRSWLSLNRNLFAALKLEKTVMFIILTLLTVVASFMIVSNLLLSITQKVKEIGILRAIGATPGTIGRIFLWQGFLMGLVGTSIGALLGVSLAWFLSKTNLIHLPADVYYIDRLPVRLDALDIGAVVMAASAIVLVATLYPAYRAAKVDPLDAIRYG